MKKKATKKDIRDVMVEEMGRGRRKIDREAQEQTKQLEKDYLKVIREGDLTRFKAFLSGLGLPEASEQYRRILKLWNDVQKQKKL